MVCGYYYSATNVVGEAIIDSKSKERSIEWRDKISGKDDEMDDGWWCDGDRLLYICGRKICKSISIFFFLFLETLRRVWSEKSYNLIGEVHLGFY